MTSTSKICIIICGRHKVRITLSILLLDEDQDNASSELTENAPDAGGVVVCSGGGSSGGGGRSKTKTRSVVVLETNIIDATSTTIPELTSQKLGNESERKWCWNTGLIPPLSS